MIPFNNIPQNLRVPLFYAEMDNSAANIFTQNKRRLIIGQKLSTGSAIANTPYLVSSVAQAVALFGRGSMLARMHKAYRDNDQFGEVWTIAVDEAAAGAAATCTATITGPATAAGTIPLYIAGQRVLVGVASGDTATAIATAIVAAVTANLDLPVTAANTAGVVTFTCRWKGLTGNDITVLDSFLGQSGGEALPAGVAIAYTAMSGGTTNPVLTALIAAMGDDEYDYIINPYTDTTSLDALALEMNDTVGRWAWNRQVYGHCYTAMRGTLSALVAAGGLRNDQHNTMAAVEVDVPNPVWEFAAAYAARNAVFLDADPARPTQTGAVNGILAPRAGKKFTLTERQSLLNYGIATSSVAGGVVRVERAITTFQKNAYGQTDVSYLDSETMHTSMYVIRNLRSIITSKYGRHKVANDGTSFAAGSAMVTPSVIRGELVSAYKRMEYDGIVENADLFQEYLIVERNASDPNRLDVLFPADYVNQLRVFALLNQFRLQYPATA